MAQGHCLTHTHTHNHTHTHTYTCCESVPTAHAHSRADVSRPRRCQRHNNHSTPFTSTDCCDGSDELSGCTNTCIEKNSAKRDELKTAIDAYKTSLEAKARYAASAASVRSTIKSRFKAVDGDLAKAEKELERTIGVLGGPWGVGLWGQAV